MNRLVIRGGRLLDPAAGIDGIYNIYVMGGRIASVKPFGSDTADITPGSPGLELIEAKGLLVTPGFIDLHTHLREPGYEYKETIRTGTLAAAAGGFTSILCMANTRPVNDNESVTRYIRRKAEEEGVVQVFPVGALSRGLGGTELTDMAELRSSGCVAVSDDGVPVTNGGLMRRALEYSKICDLFVISHAEDPSIAGTGVMNEGEVSTRLGLRGIPGAAEEAMVARDIALAELTGGRLHIAHVSTRGSVELVRMAKERGLKVTAEATPHHLTLTHEAVLTYSTDAKMNPPLRSREDVDALRLGLKDGAIDCVATDHAPHSVMEKDLEFEGAANGIVGLETAFSLIYGLVEDGAIDLTQAVKAMTINPARIAGLDRGALRVGFPADITIVDLSDSWTVDKPKLKTKSKNTPFAGRVLKGRVVKTIVGGKVVYNGD